MNLLPDELLQTIATYLKPVTLAEKTIEELLKMKEDINIALIEKTQVSTEESQFLVIKGKIALVSMKTRFFRGISLKQSYRNRMQVNLQAPLYLS